MQPWHIAWTLCIVPILAAHGAYLIALATGTASSCIPYIEGCISISRAARVGDSLFWFRGLLMPCASLLVIFWWLQKNGWTSYFQYPKKHITGFLRQAPWVQFSCCCIPIFWAAAETCTT